MLGLWAMIQSCSDADTLPVHARSARLKHFSWDDPRRPRFLLCISCRCAPGSPSLGNGRIARLPTPGTAPPPLAARPSSHSAPATMSEYGDDHSLTEETLANASSTIWCCPGRAARHRCLLCSMAAPAHGMARGGDDGGHAMPPRPGRRPAGNLSWRGAELPGWRRRCCR